MKPVPFPVIGKMRAMPSPFPGMDPYLEGYLWPDVHQALATQIRRQLAPLLQPRYVARLAISTIQDEMPESEVSIMYPDVEVLKRKLMPEPSASLQPDPAPLAGQVTPSLTIPLPVMTVRMVTVEVRDRDANQLVTSIEVLSPVNKREPGLTEFRRKRERLRAAGVHLVEIDLIRRGERSVHMPTFVDTSVIDAAPYLVTLTRAGATTMDVWPIPLANTLPVVAIPLRPPDADVPLDLMQALTTVYAEAAYQLSLDYRQPPPPPAFDAATHAWIDNLLRDVRRETQPGESSGA